MSAPPTLYAVQRPDGTIVQASPCTELGQALWEAACRDSWLSAIYKRESKYNVASARRHGYQFVPAAVVAVDPEGAGER